MAFSVRNRSFGGGRDSPVISGEIEPRLIQSQDVMLRAGSFPLQYLQELSRQVNPARLLIVWRPMGDPVKMGNGKARQLHHTSMEG
jgi:hypothetical protein